MQLSLTTLKLKSHIDHKGYNMKVMLNFKCESGEYIERYTHRETSMVDCICGKSAEKSMSAPRFLGNTTGNSASLKYKSK